MKEIMLLDHDPEIRKYITEVLQTKFGEVGITEAVNGLDATAKFHSGIDLLIMGGRSQDLQANVFLRCVRNVYTRTRIVMMANACHESNASLCYDKIIYKPFAMKELVDAVKPFI